MWAGVWVMGGRSWILRDTEVEKNVPKGREQCRTQRTSELKASSQFHAHTSL